MNSIDLKTPVEKAAGVGTVVLRKLQKLGIKTVKDLLWYVPFRYIDASSPAPISSLIIGQDAVVKAKITSISFGVTKRKYIKTVLATVSDETGSIDIIWYNQTYLRRVFQPGQVWIFIGKVGWDFSGKKKVIQAPLFIKTSQIIPVYRESAGLKSGLLRKIIQPLLVFDKNFSDPLTEEILTKFDLAWQKDALLGVHRPQSYRDIIASRNRLAFDELLILALSLRSIGSDKSSDAAKITGNLDIIKKFVDDLPFKLTASQRKSAWQIYKDLTSGKPATRLLMGDVGSGKTAVGAIANLTVASSGYQTIWLAPTEVLARQHFETLKKLFCKNKIGVGIWTGSQKSGDLASDKTIVGTHALLEPKIKFGKVGLIIIDEQHRFGVEQRSKLTTISNPTPHLLSMTATPIPRTLAHTLYGSLSISVLDELPKNRGQVITKVVKPEERNNAYHLVREQVRAGRQVFVVTPVIENSSTGNDLFALEKKSAISEYERLSKEVFPDLKIALLHGKLKSVEKNQVLSDFKKRKYDILVSTTVIEVGIDVQNATVMIVEGAENFGLASLHQLRGRVGRGAHQSYCLVFCGSLDEPALRRLSALEKITSGFKLAEIDFKLRGPGTLAGFKQSGVPELKIAKFSDIETIEKANRAADYFEKTGIPSALKRDIGQFIRTKHME